VVTPPHGDITKVHPFAEPTHAFRQRNSEAKENELPDADALNDPPEGAVMIATVQPSETLTDIRPPHPDGGDWLYAVLDGSGTLTLSDSASELVATAIPGYLNLPQGDAGHDEALGMRYDFLVELARRTQQSIVDQAVKSGELDLAALSDDATTALFADRTQPFDGLPTVDGEWTYQWDLAAPLVLITTDYEPYTDRPAPNGRIVWLDPSTEVSFVRALHTLGIVEFRVLT
jgi:hypothetical protein